jgi:D-glycero-beta-D-manno-heptose 1-phosphate adenylyltransferase
MEWNKIINDKIFHSRESLVKVRDQWKHRQEKVVFTNGCFDILHLGHMDYLSKAADLGDRLIIGVNTDESVSKIKGPNRPIIEEITRLTKLASFAFVDGVILFDEETPIELIKSVRPDVLVKGGDYKINTIVGADFVKQNGGNVIVIPFLEGHSSTNYINKISNL